MATKDIKTPTEPYNRLVSGEITLEDYVRELRRHLQKRKKAGLEPELMPEAKARPMTHHPKRKKQD